MRDIPDWDLDIQDTMDVLDVAGAPDVETVHERVRWLVAECQRLRVGQTEHDFKVASSWSATWGELLADLDEKNELVCRLSEEINKMRAEWDMARRWSKMWKTYVFQLRSRSHYANQYYEEMERETE